MEAILELQDITLALKRFSLDHISLSIFKGNVHMIMGENASGKSLLMETIRGLHKPDSGRILSEEPSILYLNQEDGLLENMSVAENIYFNHLPFKNKKLQQIDYEKLNHQCKILINELHLPFSLYDNVALLGSAQKQLLNLCKAYVCDADIVILDEPTTNLTTQEYAILTKVLSQLKSNGIATIFVTHHIDDIFLFGNQVSLLDKGKLQITLDVTQTSKEEIIHLLSINTHTSRYPRITVANGPLLMQVKDLSYKEKLVNINFDLHQGEVLGITGLAGSGRTLLANLLFGLTPYNGHITLNHRHLLIDCPATAIKNGIAYMPDNRYELSFFPTLTRDENLAFPSFKRFSKHSIINSSYLNEVVLGYVKKIHLNDSTSKSLNTLSSGNLQKILFTKWMMNRAKLFILDEPTKGIDIPSKIDIYNFINDMRRKKIGIIYISSDIEEILGICDRVAILSDHTIVSNLPTSQLTTEDVINIASTSA